MDWQFENDRPIYSQLIEQIERGIVTGIYPPGQKLPGVREMAADAGVNPNTMQRALAELETRGLVYTQRTSGRFVTDDSGQVAALQQLLATGKTLEFVRGMRAIGCTQAEIERYVHNVKEEEL